ncbi:anthranilate synthase component II [Enterococcus sp. RIT-PI-f]|uniref:anthranilate synthase component II n=1 Tax=Enterococcus sp. RIT-PI-f TaxID=1690244 RepID=UPI0006B88CF9|nr:aminodeoxychorismate/anthranilate synthase component II [Enterococcus sp. RIT-PI-f]KPG71730.1 anthranilate synthase subunit II [Enterococcus sp. RIT-PI-f]
MILLIDNYDSFTFNLVQLFPKGTIQVMRNDDPRLFDAAETSSGIVLSPGPGRPEEAGQMMEILAAFKMSKPILGICLGHQAIGLAYGAAVIGAAQVMHGKQSVVSYQKTGILKGFSGEMTVMRYHSLMIDPATMPSEFEVLAVVDDTIMAIQHREKPIIGLQFHPESLGTPQGAYFIDAFLEQTKRNQQNQPLEG